MGESRQALQEIDRAASLDSSSSAILADKGLIVFIAGKPEVALGLLQRLEQMQPGFLSPHLYLATVYSARGDDRDYVRELQAAASLRHDPDQERIAGAASSGLATGGHAGMLASLLAVQKQLYAEGRQSAYGIARTYAELHDEQATMRYLNISLARHELENISLLTDHAFQGLGGRSDYAGLLRKAGLQL
jgi:tetratricopeptide (TPR) repeat protein